MKLKKESILPKYGAVWSIEKKLNISHIIDAFEIKRQFFLGFASSITAAREFVIESSI